MKIAIVAPCPVPYMVGGAEKLWWGLATHLNEHTAHQAEIIKLPSPEHDLPAIVRSYEAFANLDLLAFDAVISGKYPAWMVRHPRHICYMLHRLRGLYDSYRGPIELPAPLAAHAGIASLRTFMRRARGSHTALPEFFARWNELAAGAVPPGMMDFPGPLAREIVRWMDDVALSPASIARYAAISATVAQRAGYFPPGVEVEVAHPPPHRAMLPGERQDHFYTVSRLDVPKRVGLIVEAMRKVRTDLPLVVGGTGPEEARLRELAAGDPRIRFAGFQGDEQVLENYRNALAVPFVPFNEDYGLIAAEAMQCAKPVITTLDSGGPCELVTDGVDGLVCAATAEALAAAMQRLADDRALAKAMGARAAVRGARVTWAAVSKALLAVPTRSPVRGPGQPRRKLVVASTFAIYPPRHGGASRSFHIYRALAPEFETVIVSLCPSGEPAFEGDIAPGVREIRIPKSAEHERRELEVQAEMGTPVTDVVLPELHVFTPRIGEVLERESRDACALVSSHPYPYPILAGLGLPVWYEAQDFEYHLKQSLFEKLPRGKELVDVVHEVEGACARAAEVILCASPDDARNLAEIYAVDAARILDVPNGTDALRIAFTTPADRTALKERMGIGATPLVFFMGSGHWPNIEAVKRVFEFASALPDVAFAVVGSVCYAFDPRMKPENVLFVGEVDEVTRNLCLQACDLAVNPMEHGSGTNIKMLDYFAAGLPVITTGYGSRGLRLQGERECRICAIDDFPRAIREVLGDGAAAAASRAQAARELVDAVFDWEAIVARVKPQLVSLADRERAQPAALRRAAS